ncbi:MAG TPA: diguanylate cyclase, partial [Noviherbaspirillum sp.]|nr:diguanylate cyclase [Noviherbaspirillum sp.]
MQEPFNPMAEQNALGILWLNEAGCITYANDAVAHLISTGTDTLVGKPIKELIVELHPSAWVELATSISPGESRLLQVTLHKAGHGSAAAEAHVLRLSDKGNRSFAVFLQGIATPVRTEELFRLQHDVIEALARDEPLAKLLNRLCLRIEAIARDLLCSVILVDEHDRVHVVAAPSIPKGYSIAIDGQPIGPKAGSCGTALYFNQPVEVSDIAHDPLWENYRQLVLPIGLVACWSQPITARDGRVLGSFAIYYRKPRGPSEFHRQLVEVCTHLTAIAIERTRMDERLHDLAFHDVLTKLPNRKLLADRGAIALANAAHAQHPVALLHIDLDRFKRINDAHGHAVGDRFLQAYADQLQAAVRKGDTVSRVGNDEFVLVLPRCDGQQAAHLAQRTLDILAEHVILGQKRFVASASIGISLYPDDAKDFQTLLRYAEMAAHQVKKGGGNGYRFFSRELNAANQELAALEQALRGALAARRLSVHYQPKMDLNRESVYGIEALARWNDPQLGMVPPARFIPVAEASGLIHELGRWVLDEACRQLAEWRAEELAIPYVEVNVSAKQLG